MSKQAGKQASGKVENKDEAYAMERYMFCVLQRLLQKCASETGTMLGFSDL